MIAAMKLRPAADAASPLAAADAHAYSTREVGRLLGIRTERARQWLIGRATSTSRQKPIVFRERNINCKYASFRELVHLMVVKRFLDNGVPYQVVRRSLDDVRERLSIPHFAHRNFLTKVFFADGRNIYLDIDGNEESCGAFLQLDAGGQLAFARFIKMFADRIDFDDIGLASRWYPDEDRLIVLDPDMAFGSPTISGRRLTTNNVYEFFNGESGNMKLTCKWFGLTKEQVEAAVMFESSIS